MPKRIKIEPHLSIEELELSYRKAKDGIQKTHYQVIWLLARGAPMKLIKPAGYNLYQ